MGASSSGLLDEAKISNIKGLVDSKFQSYGAFYHQQYSVAYAEHLHQEVEPKKEGRGLLLTRGPKHVPEEVLYRGSSMFSCWDEQEKKCRERYIVLKRDYKVEIHENMETFSRGCAAKLVLQPAGGRVFTTEAESRAHLEQTCAGILNGVKEDPYSAGFSPDVFAVYLHLPHAGHTCFLFQQEEERDHFLYALQICIRHCNLDPWCDSSYEGQAFLRALRLYRQDKGRYESWEMLLGTEEQVLASQVMEEVLPWLQSQLQARVKGKKTERIRQWLATVQACHTLVLEQLTVSLEALRVECRHTASANQTLIRSNLDQIMSSQRFLEDKVRACISKEAKKVCSESIAPYLSSILQALTENIGAGIQGMRHTLHTHMDSALTRTNGAAEDTKKTLSTLRSISLDQSYRQVERLTEKFESLKQRFGMSGTQRLVHSAHLEMEKLLDSAVYTLELFLQSSAKLEPSKIPVMTERAKERVLKQLDHDSRVVQRRLYQESLLNITLPVLTTRMGSKWKTELRQFEQYIFSDYSSFILVQNVYDDLLRNLLSKEIETVVQDAASKKSNNLLLDTSDLAISQYSLLGHTPPRSAPDSPAPLPRDYSSSSSSSAAPGEDAAPAPVPVPATAPSTAPAPEGDGSGGMTVPVAPQSDQGLSNDTKPNEPASTQSSDQSAVPVPSPLIVVTQSQQCDELSVNVIEGPSPKETRHQVQVGPELASTSDSTKTESPESATPESEDFRTQSQQSCELPANVIEPTSPQSSDPSAVPVRSPLIVVTQSQQCDEIPANVIEGPSPKETRHQVQVGTEPASASDPTATESLESATPEDSEDLRTLETSKSEAPENSESSLPIPDSSNLANLPEPTITSTQSEDVSAECAAGSDGSVAPEGPSVPDLQTSDRVTDDATTSVCPSGSLQPVTEGPVPVLKVSLGTLSEAVCCDPTAPSSVTRPTTDRAVYLRGEMKDNWEIQKLKGVQREEAAEEKEDDERTGDGEEEEKETGEGTVEERGGEITGGEPVDEIHQSFESPESAPATALTAEIVDNGETAGEVENEKKKDEKERKVAAEETGEDVEKEQKEEEKQQEMVLQKTQPPVESQPESDAELLLGSVAIIRDLVTEVTEVETVISPGPTTVSQTP